MPMMTISSFLWERKQEIYDMLSRFWPLAFMVGATLGGLSESFNKRNIHGKILFQIVLNEVVKYDIC